MESRKTSQISSPELSEVMAYAEKPHMDASLEVDQSSQKIEALHKLAAFASNEAAQQYVDALKDEIRSHSPDSEPVESKTTEQLLALSIEDLLNFYSTSSIALTVRTTNCLKREGIASVRDLIIRGQDHTLDIRNLGVKALGALEETITAASGSELNWPKHTSLEHIAQFADKDTVIPLSIVLDYSYFRYMHVEHLDLADVVTMTPEILVRQARADHAFAFYHLSENKDRNSPIELASKIIHQAKLAHEKIETFRNHIEEEK